MSITKHPKSQEPASNPHAGGVNIAMEHIQEKKNCAQRLAKHATTVAAPITLPLHAYKSKRTHDKNRSTQYMKTAQVTGGDSVMKVELITPLEDIRSVYTKHTNTSVTPLRNNEDQRRERDEIPN